MKPGEKKTFIYIPGLDFIEAGETKEETMQRIGRAEVNKEIESKKTLRRLQKQFPDCEVIPELGGCYTLIPKNGQGI